MLFAIPEGKPSAKSAVSPTFATGKLNEPDVPKISKMGIQESSTSKSQKNRRTGAPEAGSGQQERRQVWPDESLRGTYYYGKCNGGVSLVD